MSKFETQNLKIPHVGFNQVKINKHSKLFEEFINTNDFYFTHSYRIKNSDKLNINQTTCFYGEEFVAAYEVNNIAGTQFHPELVSLNKWIETSLENFLRRL